MRHTTCAISKWSRRAALAGAILSAPPAGAENLLVDGGFSEVLELAFWDPSGTGSAAWDDFECGFSQIGSGSARLAVDGSDPFAGETLSQCVEAVGEGLYTLTGSVYLSETNVAGSAQLGLVFVDGTCTSGSTLASLLSATATEQGTWLDLDVAGVAPAGTDVVEVHLRLFPGGFDLATGYFDDIELPEPGASAGLAGLGALAALASGRAVQRGRNAVTT